MNKHIPKQGQIWQKKVEDGFNDIVFVQIISYGKVKLLGIGGNLVKQNHFTTKFLIKTLDEVVEEYYYLF